MHIFEFDGWDHMLVKVFLEPDGDLYIGDIVPVHTVHHVELHLMDEITFMTEEQFIAAYPEEAHDILGNAMEDAASGN